MLRNYKIRIEKLVYEQKVKPIIKEIQELLGLCLEEEDKKYCFIQTKGTNIEQKIIGLKELLENNDVVFNEVINTEELFGKNY